MFGRYILRAARSPPAPHWRGHNTLEQARPHAPAPDEWVAMYAMSMLRCGWVQAVPVVARSVSLGQVGETNFDSCILEVREAAQKCMKYNKIK